MKNTYSLISVLSLITAEEIPQPQKAAEQLPNRSNIILEYIVKLILKLCANSNRGSGYKTFT